MSTLTHKNLIHFALTSLSLTFTSLLLVSFAQIAHAQAPTVMLQVCSVADGCGGSVSAQTGDDVTINWFISGDLNNCVLYQGTNVLQNIDTSSLPGTDVSDSLVYTLPEGNSEFSLNCDGYTDGATVQLAPIVDIWTEQGPIVSINPDTGQVNEVDVRWDSTYADWCGILEYEFVDTDPGNIRTANHDAGQDYSNAWRPSGQAEFDGWPMPRITEQTTFYITCYNSVTGSETTASTTVTINLPPPPEPVTVDMWADSYSLVVDDFTGYAYTRVYTRSENNSACYYRAYAADGVTSIPNPSGYGAWSGHEDRDHNVRLATTTVFEFECQRGEVTYGGVTYPPDASSTRITINIVSTTTTDRLDIPPATVTLTPVPSTATSTQLDLLYGEGSMTFNIYATNVQRCYLRAYENPAYPTAAELQNDPRDDDTEERDLDGWTREHSWEDLEADGSRVVNRTITTNRQTMPTTYSVECWRDYDIDNFAPGSPEWNNGYANDTHFIDTYTVGALPPPTVELFAGGFAADANYIYDNAVSVTNFRTNDIGGVGRVIEMDNENNPASITFPFTGDSDTYDIYVNLCDEDDGVAEFTFTSSGVAGNLGTILTDNPNSWDDNCNDLTLYTTLMASGVTVNDGDEVTVDCTNVVATGERCRFLNMSFIPSDFSGNYEVTPEPGFGYARTPLVWQSQNTAWCWGQPAQTAGGVSYEWSTQWQTTATEVELIASSTAFSVECYRDTDSQIAASTVQLTFPGSQEFSAVVAATGGDCKLTVDGEFQTAPNGYIPNTSVPISDPSYGLCIPAADLGMLSPSPSQLSVNNVTGTYDIRALLALTNHGPGALPTTSEVAYYASTELDLTVPYYAAYVARYGDASDETNPAPLYSDGIAEPIDPDDYSNPREVTVNDVIFDDVPFGTHTMCSRVNIASDYSDPSDALVEPDLNPVDGNQDLANNIPSCTPYTLEVPEPPMGLSADPTIVRGGQGAELEWDINVTYQMDCSVRGPGGANDIPDFNTIDVGAGHSDSATIGPLTATSEFIFTCTEDLTNTTFTRTATVEVVPDFEEI